MIQNSHLDTKENLKGRIQGRNNPYGRIKGTLYRKIENFKKKK